MIKNNSQNLANSQKSSFNQVCIGVNLLATSHDFFFFLLMYANYWSLVKIMEDPCLHFIHFRDLCQVPSNCSIVYPHQFCTQHLCLFLQKLPQMHWILHYWVMACIHDQTDLGVPSQQKQNVRTNDILKPTPAAKHLILQMASKE